MIYGVQSIALSSAICLQAAGITRPLTSTVIAKDSDGFLSESLDRTKYLASEMPQGFHFDIINTAYEKVHIFYCEIQGWREGGGGLYFCYSNFLFFTGSQIGYMLMVRSFQLLNTVWKEFIVRGFRVAKYKFTNISYQWRLPHVSWS